MARQRPSFLKRQKEMQRNAKAAAKRARRESRRQDGGNFDSMMARVDEFGHIIDVDDEKTEDADEDAHADGKPNPGA